MTPDDEPQGRLGARASGGLVGLGSAGSGLTVGPETNLGKILILASPITSQLVDYAVIRGGSALRYRRQQRNIRQARQTLQEGIDDPETTDEQRDEYKRMRAELMGREIARSVARALDDLGASDDLDSIAQRMKSKRVDRTASDDVRQHADDPSHDQASPDGNPDSAIKRSGEADEPSTEAGSHDPASGPRNHDV